MGETRVGIDSPAGFVEAFVAWDGRKVGGVRFLNVPSFLYRQDVRVNTDDFGELNVDVAFGGAFYAYLDGAQAGLRVVPENVSELVELGDQVKHAVMAAVPLRHPQEPELNTLYGTIIHGAPRDAANHQANVCVFAEREVDRSPTGTGTSGRVAQLVARGLLGLGEELRNESIVGSVFTGKALLRTRVGEFDAVVPEVGGTAAILGFNQWVLEPGDELGAGFLVR